MNFRQLIKQSIIDQFKHDRDLEKRDRDADQNYHNNKRNNRINFEQEVDRRVFLEVEKYKQEIIHLTKKLRNSREDFEAAIRVETTPKNPKKPKQDKNS